jgi:NDP-sugar pyrophosphorylase family protein
LHNLLFATEAGVRVVVPNIRSTEQRRAPFTKLEIFSNIHKMNALILAAGFGTRMEQFAPGQPKSFLALGKGIVIDEQVRLLREAGVENIYILTNAKYRNAFDDWRKEAEQSKIIILNNTVTRHEVRNGAIGDLDFFVRTVEPRGSFLVLGSDNLFDTSLRDIVDFFKKDDTRGIVGVHLFEKTNFLKQENEAVMDPATHRLLALNSKPSAPISPYLASMIYLLPQNLLYKTKEFLAAGENHDNAARFIAWLVEQGFPIFCYEMAGRRFDVGSPETYQATIRDFKVNALV